MKKIFVSMLVLAALASCSQDENMGMGNENRDPRVAIVPNADIEANVISRAAVEGTTFKQGSDVFRLSAFESEEEPTTNWTATGKEAFENLSVNCTDANGTLALSTPKYYPASGSGQKLWFYAYAPFINGTTTYNKGNGTTGPTVTYTITGEEDIMTGKVTGTNGFAGVAKGGQQTHPKFNFTHLLKKITFKVKASDTFEGGAIEVTKITVKNVQTSATLDVVAGTLTFTGEENQSLTLPGSNTVITAEGADVPGCLMFESGDTFTVCVTAGGITYADATVTLTGEKAGQAGVSHEVTLTFNRSGIVPTASITDWTDGAGADTDIQ